MALAPAFLAQLRCPKSKAELIYFPRGESDDAADGLLVCPASALAYRVEADVPVLLEDEATALDPKDLARLVARAKTLGLRLPA